MEATHIQLLNVLLTISRFFGISPSKNPSRLNVYYQVFITSITLCFSLVSIFTNCFNNYAIMTSIHRLIDLLSSTMATTLGVSMQAAALIQAEFWRKLLQELNIESKENLKKRIYYEIFIIHFICIARMIWNICAFTIVVGVEMNKYYLHIMLHEYFGIILTGSIMHINCLIKHKFRLLHKNLLTRHDIFHHHISQMKQTERDYRNAMVILDDFNNIFGYPIMFLMGYSLTVMLNSLCVALKFISFNNTNEVLILMCSTINTIFLLVMFAVCTYIIHRF